jgi:hypothetical protein
MAEQSAEDQAVAQVAAQIVSLALPLAGTYRFGAARRAIELAMAQLQAAIFPLNKG